VNTRVWTADRGAAVARLRRWAEDLAGDPAVVGVVLFGSLARGDSTARSDADVLVVLRSDERRFHERLPNASPDEAGIGVDLFPYTLEEARQSFAEGWGVVRPALREGIVLFEREGALDILRRSVAQ